MADAAVDLVLLDGVRWRGTPVPGERSQALLAALALEAPRTAGTDRLVHEVWGDDGLPAAPAKALQVLVSRTRAQTDPRLVVRSGSGYRLGEVTADTAVLRQHSAQAAAALDRGDAFAARDAARSALSVRVTAAGEAAAGPLEELHRVAAREQQRARVTLALALVVLGEHAEALDLLEPEAARRPGDETLLAATLRSELAVRGAPAALERYEAHRLHLRDTLGTDPGPELQQLLAELLAHDRPVREGLVHDASRLIGRDDDVQALSATIRASRVTSIVGAGGLGKTRLAHLMGRLADQPVVHFVELAGVTSPEGVAVEVGSALGVRESLTGRHLPRAGQRQDLEVRILEQLGNAPTLLILDNCEHLVGAVADLVAGLVARAPRLRVLTTTRAPLGLAAERVYPLPQLGRADAVELFRDRATSARPGVRLDDERIGSLVERLDGLPLAVELAAAKVRVMSVDEIERRLENRFALLRGGSRDAPERHQTLLAVIDWSWNLLSEDERVALRRLSVFRDGFSLEGAAAVVGVEDAVEVVTALVDQSLVTVHEGETVRYRLLETVREFGRMQLTDAGEDRVADSRLRAWVVAHAGSAHARLQSREQVAAMRALRVEEGNITDVLRRALDEGDVSTVVSVMAALALFWLVEGNHLKVVNLAVPVEDVVAEAAVPAGADDDLRGVLCALVTNTMIILGAPSPRSLRRLRELGPGTGSVHVRAQVQVLLAMSSAERFGDLHVLDGLLDDPEPEVARLAHMWVSQARENAGDLEGALEAARIALELCTDPDEGPWMRAMLTSQLASLAIQVGDYDNGRANAERALDVMDSLGAVEDTLQLKSALALLDIQAGRLDDAERLLAETAADERGEFVLGSNLVLLSGIAELALARGDVPRGLRLYREAVVALRELSFPGMEMPAGFAPWILYPEAGAVSAHARCGARSDIRAMRDDLATKGGELIGGDQDLDYPVTGAVLYALAVWELTGEREAEAWRRAVRLLITAERFAYNRMLPSLSWGYAADLAEERCPELAAAVRAELAALPASGLRDAAHHVVAELG